MIQTRKRGAHWHVDYIVGSNRLRGSLGTKDRKVASHLKSRIEVSMAEGSKSAGWSDLRRVLPAETYHRFSSHAGLAKHAESTWSGLLSIFWKDCDRRKLKKGSVVRYQSTVDRFTEFLSRRKIESLADISKELVLEFRDWREAAIAKNSRSRGGSGLYQDMSCLRYILGKAVENGLLASNPVQKEQRPEIQRGTKPFNGEELERLGAVCTEPEDRLLYLILRWTGMRGSDVADLRWKDFRFLTHEIVKKTIKRGTIVQIPLQYSLWNELMRRRGSDPNPEEFIVTLKNKSVSRVEIYNWLHLIGKKAKVSDAHPHRFRASLAVDLLMKEATLFEVAKILGDQVATVEKHYASFVAPMRARVKGLLDDDTKGLEA